MPSICQGNWDCQNCPKAVSNAIAHIIYQRGFHRPAHKCEENFILFLMKGEMLVNSQEYAGTMLREGEFILQAIGSKFEMLAMTECECIYYRFVQPELFCDLRFNHIMKEVSPPLIYSPLKIIPELQYFLNGSITYLKGDKVCRELLSLKRKELAFVLGYYYSDYDLASLWYIHFPNIQMAFNVLSFRIIKSKDGRRTGTIRRIHYQYIFVGFSIVSFMNLCMNGCWHAARKVFWTTCLIPITVSQRFVINMVSNPCLISPISVKSLLEPLRVH